jgi:hypothetical protein
MAPTGPRITFYDLPAELRVRIYRLAFFTGYKILPKLRVKRKRPSYVFPGHLLRASRPCAKEAAPILYGEHQFTFESLFNGVVFMQRIGETNCSFLTDVNLDTFWFRYTEARELGLNYPTALVKMADFIAKQCTSLRFLRLGDVEPLGKIFVMKTLDNLKYLVGELAKSNLPNVYYKAPSSRLVITAKTLSAECLVSLRPVFIFKW